MKFLNNDCVFLLLLISIIPYPYLFFDPLLSNSNFIVLFFLLNVLSYLLNSIHLGKSSKNA